VDSRDVGSAPNKHGYGVAATQTQRYNTRLCVASAHYAEHRNEASSSAGAEWMPETNCASMEIEAIFWNVQFLSYRT
jgi:hypothetical protein